MSNATILITGPESSGKTTLAQQLAASLGGVYVAEVARAYLEARDGRYTEADLPVIWQQQAAAEDTARASSAAFVICDTGPEVIRIWAEVKYGRCPEAILRASEERYYDLVLLCAPDLPWVADPLRESPELSDRLELFNCYLAILPVARTYIISGDERLEQVLKLIDKRT